MSQSSEVEQLAERFNEVTGRFLQDVEQKAELARAMKDEEALIKEQIKSEMIKTMRQIFSANYRQITGTEAWS